MSDQQACIFCLLRDGKVQSAKIYEDNEVFAFLDIKPATQGHIQVVSKTHAPLISLLPPEERIKLFNTAISIGSGLVKKLGASGITYLINEGAGAGQRVAHASIQIIPRYEADSVSISWEDKEFSQEEINSYLKSVISKLQSTGEAPVQESEPVQEEAPAEEEEIVVEEERVPRYW